MKKPQNEVAVGMFVIVGFVLLSLVVFFISGVYLFRSGYTVNVTYNYVSILDKGAPVRMAGVRVGEVNRVDLIYDDKEGAAHVQVKLFIEAGIKIRANYLFKIQGTHVLSEPHIEITPMPGATPYLKGGDVVAGVPLMAIENLIDRAGEIATNLANMTGQLNGAMQDKQVADAIREITLNMAAITGSLKVALSGSEGDVKQSLANIKESTESLQVVMNKIESGEGTAGQLLMKDEIYQDLKAFIRDIKLHPWKLLKKDKNNKKFLIF